MQSVDSSNIKNIVKAERENVEIYVNLFDIMWYK